jgi:hypothetical protein
VIAHTPTERVPLMSWGAGWRLSRGSRIQAITAFESGGSVTQGDAEACAYFQDAAIATRAAFGHGCSSPPTSERLIRLSSHAILFDDKAGLKGEGIPSGGKYVANGLLTYVPTQLPTIYRVTCTRSTKALSICAVILKQFLSLYGNK